MSWPLRLLYFTSKSFTYRQDSNLNPKTRWIYCSVQVRVQNKPFTIALRRGRGFHRVSWRNKDAILLWANFFAHVHSFTYFRVLRHVSVTYKNQEPNLWPAKQRKLSSLKLEFAMSPKPANVCEATIHHASGIAYRGYLGGAEGATKTPRGPNCRNMRGLC